MQIWLSASLAFSFMIPPLHLVFFLLCVSPDLSLCIKRVDVEGINPGFV